MKITNPLNAELERRLQHKYAEAARIAAPPPTEQVDEHLIDDFLRYVHEDPELHSTLRDAYYSNLLQKINRGNYDSERAPKLFNYFIERHAAPKYVEEFFPESQWHEVFPPRFRAELAQRMRDNFEAAYEAGDLQQSPEGLSDFPV